MSAPKKGKKQTKVPKPVHIHHKHSDSSPHLLNLRECEHELDLRHEESDSFEEKFAAFDNRMREMPDLLKTRAAVVSRIWEERTDSFLNHAARFGNGLQKRFAQAAKETAQILASKRKVHHHLIARLPQFTLVLVLLFLVTIPLQGFLLYRTIHDSRTNLVSHWTSASAHTKTLQTAIQSGNLETTHTELTALLQDLTAMRQVSDRLGPLRILLPDNLQLADTFLRLGEQGISSINHLAGQALDIQIGTAGPGLLIRTARQELLGITAFLDRSLRKKVPSEVLGPLLGKLNNANDVLTVLTELYGAKDPRTILLIFQNPRELRATGGFAGSFALLRIRDGAIESIESPEGGTYAVQGQLPLARISPQPLHLINPRFELQDANWWPDFPHSARKITELYEASGGPTVDAVVAITARVGEELLKLHGPLDELNAENFIDTLQATIARDRAADPSIPKRIITSLIPDMQEILTQTAAEQPKELLLVTARLLEQKDIQLWARQEEVQATIKRLGWSGELKQTQGDYLAVITSNVAGGKTDGVVTETVEHETHITASSKDKAMARETVNIQRTHNGTKNDPVLGYRNVSYIRVYVPEGARLINVSGNNPPPPYMFESPNAALAPDPDVRAAEASIKRDRKSGAEIWAESGKTIFGLWLVVDPGQTAEVTLTYDLPLQTYGPTVPYSLIVDPQGGKEMKFKSKVTLDDNLKTLTGSQDGTWQATGWNYEGPLNKTVVTSGVLYRL